MTLTDLLNLFEESTGDNPTAASVHTNADVSSVTQKLSNLGGLGKANVSQGEDSFNKEVIIYHICPVCKKKERKPATEDGFFTETDTEAGSDC